MNTIQTAARAQAQEILENLGHMKTDIRLAKRILRAYPERAEHINALLENLNNAIVNFGGEFEQEIDEVRFEIDPS